MRFNEMEYVKQNQMDFMPRERRGDVRNIIIAFLGIIVMLFISVYSPLLKQWQAYATLVAVVTLVFLCVYVVYRKQVNLDLVMSTEYQNMLFAQSLTIGCSFCFIVRRDGTIVYANDGITSVFPHFDYAKSRSLEGVFEQGTVRLNDRERIMAAIHTGSIEHLIFPIFNHRQEKKDYILTVEPINRPSGFSVIRSREYHGQRSSSAMMPDLLRSTTLDKLDHLLTNTSAAHYTTDGYGRFEYVNPAFERLFGYETGKILEAKLSLHHLIFSFGDMAMTDDRTLSDYSGIATVISKSGARRDLPLTQRAMRDVNGKAIGATGSIVLS